MEEKNLDADQRIELIQQMIRGTRQRLSFGSSNLFLIIILLFELFIL